MQILVSAHNISKLNAVVALKILESGLNVTFVPVFLVFPAFTKPEVGIPPSLKDCL